jgi:hypothetical protein
VNMGGPDMAPPNARDAPAEPGRPSTTLYANAAAGSTVATKR